MKYFNLPQSYHDIMDQWKLKISPTWTVSEAHHNIKEAEQIRSNIEQVKILFILLVVLKRTDFFLFMPIQKKNPIETRKIWVHFYAPFWILLQDISKPAKNKIQ